MSEALINSTFYIFPLLNIQPVEEKSLKRDKKREGVSQEREQYTPCAPTKISALYLTAIIY